MPPATHGGGEEERRWLGGGEKGMGEGRCWVSGEMRVECRGEVLGGEVRERVREGHGWVNMQKNQG